MSILIEGRSFEFLLLILASAFLAYYIYSARRGYRPQIRKMAPLEAIPEAIGRSVETGRPVLFSVGTSTLYSGGAPQTLAGLSVLGYTANIAVELDVKIAIPLLHPEVIPVADEIIRQAYITAGKVDEYDPVYSVRHYGKHTFSWTSGILGHLQREKPGAFIYMGSMLADSVMVAESGHRAGAMMIFGTASSGQMPFIVAAADYSLIGEELYAAGAYLSQDPVLLGSITGQDLTKALILALILLGTIFMTFGIDFLNNLFSM
jgi:hypothetical protein